MVVGEWWGVVSGYWDWVEHHRPPTRKAGELEIFTLDASLSVFSLALFLFFSRPFRSSSATFLAYSRGRRVSNSPANEDADLDPPQDSELG